DLRHGLAVVREREGATYFGRLRRCRGTAQTSFFPPTFYMPHSKLFADPGQTPVPIRRKLRGGCERPRLALFTGLPDFHGANIVIAFAPPDRRDFRKDLSFARHGQQRARG